MLNKQSYLESHKTVFSGETINSVRRVGESRVRLESVRRLGESDHVVLKLPMCLEF
jgi:hypothetical protein